MRKSRNLKTRHAKRRRWLNSITNNWAEQIRKSEDERLIQEIVKLSKQLETASEERCVIKGYTLNHSILYGEYPQC